MLKIQKQTSQTHKALVWQKEELFFEHASYFQRVLKEIESAERRVDLEMYMFEPEGLGQTILDALIEAAHRGVHVRILIDAIGSPNWSNTLIQLVQKNGLEIRIYHPIRRALQLLMTLRWVGALSNLNRRDHRKMILIDQTCAYVGSMNIASQHGDWRETGIRVEGGDTPALDNAFERVWQRAWLPYVSNQTIRRVRGWWQRNLRPHSQLVKTNDTHAKRRQFNRERVHRIQQATQRVWITSAYFVPSPTILAALSGAASRGCEVQLLLPQTSDVPIVKWLGELYYHTLLNVGIQIHEYTPSMMHAKTLMIDDWFVLGTCNLNQRSLYRDLELDLVVISAESKQQLTNQFMADLQQSETISLAQLDSRPWIRQIGGRLAWLLKSWM